MLVLSRKQNESIVINDNITLVVVEIRGDKVRLGIEAPKSVPVHRKEIHDAIQASNAEKQARGEPVTKIVHGSKPHSSPRMTTGIPRRGTGQTRESMKNVRIRRK